MHTRMHTTTHMHLHHAPAHAQVPTVVIVEPDSLPNLATNLGTPRCGNDATQTAYTQGIGYAVQQLHERAPHATLYLDAGHGGWLGWPEQADHFATVIKNLPGGVYHHLRGFATNVANYQVGVTEPRAVPSRGPPRPARIHTPVRPFTGPRRAVPSRGLPRPPVTIPRRMVLQCAHGRPRMLRRPVGAARACTPCMCVPWPRGRARRSHVCMPCPRMHAQVRSALAVQLGQQ